MRHRWAYLIVPAALIVAGCSAPDVEQAPKQPTSRDVAAMLPLPINEVVDAATVAERFASAYETWRYDENPSVYLGRLAPYTTQGLISRLAKSSTAQDLVIGRRVRHEIAVGRGSSVSLRSIDEQELMFVVRVDQVVTTTGTKSYTHEYAIWLVRTGQSRWRVVELAPASASDEGSIWIAD